WPAAAAAWSEICADERRSLAFCSFRARTLAAPAQPQRREGLFLLDLDFPLANHLKRRRETRRKCRGTHRRVDNIGHEIFVESCPVSGTADQLLEGLACLDQRPDGAHRELDARQCLALALHRVGGKEIV